MDKYFYPPIDHFGMAYTSHILDQVKTLGFQQATATSISLGIDDDLLTIPSKGWLVQDAEQQSFILEKYHDYGNVHAVEKLRQSIEIWYATSEYLRHEMNLNFRMTDPLNPVHIMSFSGARGNASQVHQLVGMRGLMSDQFGLALVRLENVVRGTIGKAIRHKWMPAPHHLVTSTLLTTTYESFFGLYPLSQVLDRSIAAP